MLNRECILSKEMKIAIESCPMIQRKPHVMVERIFKATKNEHKSVLDSLPLIKKVDVNMHYLNRMCASLNIHNEIAQAS